MKTLFFVLMVPSLLTAALGVAAEPSSQTRVALGEGRWLINGRPTNPGSAAEGLLMNVRMVNAVFEDRARPAFDPEANADRFIARIPEYAANGVNAFTICLQGGMPGYEGAVNSAFEPDGSLRPACLARAERVVRACDRSGVVVILGLYYQRQSRILRDEAAVRAGVANAARWVTSRGFRNVVLEVANEYPHAGFAHAIIRDPKGQASLIRLAKKTAPGLLVTASGYGDGKVHAEVAEACDFLTPHWNGTKVEDIPARVAGLKRFGKPIVCNEDDKLGEDAVAAMRASVTNGCAYGLMLKDHNQAYPFRFDGPADDPVYYEALKAIATARQQASAAARPHTWQRWEHTLTSARSYANPYADATVRVTFSGPGGRALRAYGFWDGDSTFRIRCAFPVAGMWQWETECSDETDAGLHRQRGSVEVVSYNGRNALYGRGFLKVSPDRRHLTYGDGAPFLWMGDTAWSAPQRSSDEEWNVYLADRAAKHFTVVQVGPASEWAGPTNRLGQRPFADRTCSQWNPAYWQSFEEKIQRANEAGLVVLVVGLMEPVHRYPGAGQACLFARNLVARLFGNFAMFSPSFDSNFMPLANEVGRAAREATAVHLITQHPGTPWNQPTPTFSLKYYDEPYLDFVGVQTGHNGGHLDWCAHHAIEWNLQLYRRQPHKPVVNLEAMYDAQGTNGWRALDARGQGWRTWLSGACGYTYGAGDVPPKAPLGGGAIWKWVTDPAKHDYWQKALQWESAHQMKHLHDFLAALPWWRLEPAHELILNQPPDVTRRMALARTASGEVAVAYLPDNEAIEVNLSDFSSRLTAQWFDPRSGSFAADPSPVANSGRHRFAPPARADWVLLLRRPE